MSRKEQSLTNAQIDINRAVFCMNTDKCSGSIVGYIDDAMASLKEARKYYKRIEKRDNAK